MARILDGNSDPIFDDVSAADTLAALGDSLTLELTGQAGAAIALTDVGASVLTVTFEASVDGANFFPYLGTNQATGVQEGTATGNGLWGFHTSGLARLRARITAWTSGSIKADGKAGQGAGPAAFSGAVSIAPTPIDVDASLIGEVSANNSSNTPLGIGAVFLGTADDVRDYAAIIVSVDADVDSAVDGLQVEFSPDNVTWYISDNYTITASSLKTFTFQPVFRWFRVRYTNGAVGQGTFDLQVQFRPTTVKPSSHRLDDNVTGQDDATLQKSIVAAKLPSGSYQNIDATAGGALRVVVSEENQDAFGRVRVSNPVTLLDSTFTYNLNPRVFEDISTGNGVVTYDSAKKAALLSVTAGAPGVAGLQSYQYTHYNPGKSHLIFMTFCGDPLATGYSVNQKFEVGYFDDDNGIFIRGEGPTNIYAVRRSSVTGVITEEAVERANFNIDVLDGSGSVDNPSGILLDANQSQILVIDLQFLGVGRVRLGLAVAGAVVYAHEFNFANVNPNMYMQSGTLPIRWRFEDTSVLGWARTDAYCAMVTSEGGAEKNRGIPFSTGNPPGTTITAANGADTHVISIQPSLLFNAQTNRIWNILESVSLVNTGSTEVLCKIWYDANVTGGAWVGVDTSDSGMEYNITATHAPGTGIEIGRFAVPASAQVQGAGGLSELLNRLPIALNAAGTTPVGKISLTAAGVGGTSPVLGMLSWREVR